jgi:hypothetical protein
MANNAVVNSEVARIGARAYATKKKVSAGRWKRIVGEAHKRGFTVDSYLDTNKPDALKARTRSGIAAEASKTMSEAYKPVEAELTQEESRVKSIDDKRKRDNQYYLDWLTARTAERNTHAAAADQKLIDTSKQIQDETAAQHAQARDQLMQGAAATPGNVSNPQQSTALNDKSEEKRGIDLVANARQDTANTVASSQKRQAADQAINFAQIAASESRRFSDTANRLKDVADGRTKAALSKGADTAKEISRLLDVEIDKANSNREFDAALEKLGIQSDAVDQRADAAKLSSSDKAKARALQSRIANRTAGQRDKEIELKAGNLDVAWYRAKHGARKKGDSTDADPQKRFEAAVATLASQDFFTTDKDGKEKKVKNRTEYVKNRRSQMISALMKKDKVSREIASRAVDAFIQKNGEDPGDYKGYKQKTTHGPNG